MRMDLTSPERKMIYNKKKAKVCIQREARELEMCVEEGSDLLVWTSCQLTTAIDLTKLITWSTAASFRTQRIID